MIVQIAYRVVTVDGDTVRLSTIPEAARHAGKPEHEIRREIYRKGQCVGEGFWITSIVEKEQ